MPLAQDGDSLEIHHPLLQRLLQLWDVKRGQRPMPVRADFDVLELKDWLGNLVLVDVLEGATEFRYRLYGSTSPPITGVTSPAGRPPRCRPRRATSCAASMARSASRAAP